MIGGELNQPYYSQFPKKYAPYNLTKIVALYPSVFAANGVRRGDGSTQFMEHFIAYVQGAAANTTLPIDSCYPWDTGLPPYPPGTSLLDMDL